MANRFGADILIQAENIEQAAAFYVAELGLEITGSHSGLIELRGPHINIFIEHGPKLGPVLEIFVEDVEAMKRRLVERGCTVIKDEPEFPRCYVTDPFGLTYNLAQR
jgi:predicted enzyme related to lactoylglutathione lyase